MTDYVSVDSTQLKLLAAAIKDSVANLSSNDRAIVNQLAQWNASWSAGQVDALGTWLDGQWHPMQQRAEYAEFALNQPVMTSPGDPAASWRSVPWNLTDAQMSSEATQEAALYKKQLGSGDPAQVAQAQKALADAMDTHATDPAWMQSFATSGGMTVIDSANKSVIGNHLPVSAQGQKQLASYAAGVAGASLMSANGAIAIPSGSFSVLYGDNSVVTTGIMMKFGPAGTSYGAQFLSDASAAALNWRDHNPPRPGYSKGGVNLGGVIPTGYVQGGDKYWYSQFGIDVDYSHGGDPSGDISLIRGYDPVLSILNVTGDNKQASQDLLTGPDGGKHAQQLVQYSWSTPPGMDDSAAPSKVIAAATLDRTAEFAKSSAQAALNVFDAGVQLQNHDPRNGYDKDLYPALPSTLARTLSQMASAYAVDMALSTNGTGDPDTNDIAGADPNVPGGFGLQLNSSDIDAYIKLFTTDPAAAGSFQGAINAQLQVAAALNVTHPKGPTLLQDTGYLNGLTQLAISTQHFDAAAAQDATNAREATFLNASANLAWGGASLLPVGAPLGGFLGGAAAAISTAAGGALFPTDAASTYSSGEQYTLNADLTNMQVYVAQGYMKAGVISPDATATFVHDGVIDPQNAAEKTEFDKWYHGVSGQIPPGTPASTGFLSAVEQFATHDDKLKPPQG
jgi:hypothetical protein